MRVDLKVGGMVEVQGVWAVVAMVASQVVMVAAGVASSGVAVAHVGVEPAEMVEMADAAARCGGVGMWEGRLVAEMAAAAAAHKRH